MRPTRLQEARSMPAMVEKLQDSKEPGRTLAREIDFDEVAQYMPYEYLNIKDHNENFSKL